MRAVLAGGLVLGVGATLTLAAWNDAEHVSGDFGASVFDTESTVGSVWASHDEPPGATLTFNGAGMSPGASRYAHVDIRTTATTTVGGDVRLEQAGKSGSGILTDVLEYRVVSTMQGVPCDATAFPSGLAYVNGGTMPHTPPTGTLNAGATHTVRFCFDVRIKSSAGNSYQGKSGTLTWRFLATSKV